MTFFEELAQWRPLLSAGVRRRGALLAGLVFGPRVLVPVLALALFRDSGRGEVSIAFALAALLATHGLALRVFATEAEAELYARTAESVVQSDVLHSGGTGERSRAELSQAIYHTAQVLTQTLPALAADLLASLVVASVVLRVEPARLVAAGGVVFGAVAALLVSSRRSGEAAMARAWQAQSEAYTAFCDVLDGRLEIVASGRRNAFVADLKAKTARWSRGAATIAAFQALSGRTGLLLVASVTVAALYAAGVGSSLPRVSARDAALFASVTPPFLGLAQGAEAIARARRWVRVVVAVLTRPAVTGASTAAPPELPTTIRFERVSYSYSGADPEESERFALRHVDLFFKGPGAWALVGPNGSGKSTCLRLLLGLARPTEGRLSIGTHPQDDFDGDAWRARAAFLPQRPYMPLQADVRRAIRWLAPAAPDARMRNALDRVGLLDALERSGSDPLGVRMESLSVGQRQRVALARTLCSGASLYLFDEPDANLDRAGIAMVAALVRDLARDATVIFAAHTPDLVSAASGVIRLEGGRIVPQEPTGPGDTRLEQ
jgi:ABC-type multidrug transport system fused ATPase/permease subunit